MTTEINGLPPVPCNGPNSGQEAQNQKDTQQAGTGQNQTQAAGEMVSLTGAAQQLRSLQEEVVKMPVVDTQRVEAIKQAIANGTFEVEPARVADKMITLERALDDMG